MKKVQYILAIVALSSCLLSQQAGAQIDAVRMNTLLDQYHRAGVFNGVLLVAKEDRVIYQAAIGEADMEWKQPNSMDTRFRIGSLTKQFTAALVLLLMEDGRIDVHAPLSRYIPEYPKEQADGVTVHHLLTHTSGIPGYTELPNFVREIMRTTYTREEFMKVFSGLPRQFAPGTAFRYSNSGYFLLGVIIERVTGAPYDQVLRDRLALPFGLNNTGYEHNTSLIPRMARGYQRIPNGYERTQALDSSVPFAAGMLYSTAGDLLRWTRLLHTGNVFSKKETLEMMITPTLDGYACGLKVSAMPVKGGTVRNIHHSGGINGFSSQLWYMPDEACTIVALDNTMSDAGLAAETAFALLYEQQTPAFRFPIAEEVAAIIETEGLDVAVRRYRELREEAADRYDFSEQELNGLGYYYMGQGKLDIAMALLGLNLEMFPEAYNAWDSMGEAYMNKGDNEEAIRHYRRALELNPASGNAKAMLKKLGVVVEDVTVRVPETVLDSYLGRYELQPGFVLTVTRVGNQLSIQATSQPRVEVYPATETKFYLKVVDAQVTFVRDADGSVNELILHQGGKDMPAKRIP
jgi:CubicO group peptidase (beta-lactamase class C family)